MEEVLYYTELFDFYGTLLTEKQQNYFKDYYFNNLSLSEITRNAIHNQLREAKEKLEYYEKNLQLVDKQKKVKKIYLELTDEKVKKELKNLFDL